MRSTALGASSPATPMQASAWRRTSSIPSSSPPRNFPIWSRPRLPTGSASCARPASPSTDRSRMKAIVIHRYGPPDVLTYEEVPDPQLRAGEIRIRVHAATINRVLDVSLRAGKEGARGPILPLIPGVDCAGVVDAVGQGVTRWRQGMRVAAAGVMPLDTCGEDGVGYRGPTGLMGIKRPGGFAEMVAVPACAASARSGE